MKFLPDTHLLVWSAVEQHRTPATARAILEDANSELFFSAVSFWEIAIKRGLNRPDFQLDPGLLYRALLSYGYRELPLKTEHALTLLSLPPIHKDLFDRMLVAQAISEDITLLTCDGLLARYPGPIRRI